MKPKILFLTISGRQGASSRYRVYQFLPVLEQAGFALQVMPSSKAPGRGMARLWSTIVEQWAILKAARHADLVFIQKRLFGTGFIKLLSSLGKPLVFDFDDAIFTSPKGDWSSSTQQRTLARLEAVLRSAQLVIAGNGFLHDYAAPFSRQVEIIPTVVDTERYALKQHQAGGAVVLGWIGHSVNHPYLCALGAILGRLSRSFPGLRVLVISDKDVQLPGVAVENRRWSEASEIKDLMDMDVGLMPLPDDEWSRGKCALKAIQYMASGLPVVCSAVGANREVVRDGVDGYLARNDEEWFNALSVLITSHERRCTLGAAGRARVVESYSLTAAGDRMASLLRGLLGEGPGQVSQD